MAKGKCRILAIGIAVVAFAVTLGVAAVGCSGNSVDGSSSRQGSDVAAGSNDVTSGPEYVLTRSVSYEHDGRAVASTEDTLDEHGNVVERIEKSAAAAVTHTFAYERDENGFCTSYSVTADGSAVGKPTVTTFSYENQYDDEGRLIQSDRNNQRDEYAYYPGGTLKMHQYADYNAETGSPDNPLTSRKYEFTKEGLPEHMEHISYDVSNCAELTDYEWTYDAKGAPISCTRSNREEDLDGKVFDSGTEVLKVETDEAGNVVALRHEDGSLMSEYEYARVDNPSLAVRSFPNMLNI